MGNVTLFLLVLDSFKKEVSVETGCVPALCVLDNQQVDVGSRLRNVLMEGALHLHLQHPLTMAEEVDKRLTFIQ